MPQTGRPDFSPDMSVQQFEQYYWYKEELVGICRQYGLSAHGTKAELMERIKQALTGADVQDDRRAQSVLRKKQVGTKELTLQTRLIPDGFTFNKQARTFFASYYGVPKFSFTKEMAAALRDAEKRGDHDMTVADLIRIYEQHKRNRKRNKNSKENGEHNREHSPEERTYQWNTFVKDFNADPRTKGMKNRMKVAAFLWRYVRDRPGTKRYTAELVDQFQQEIRELEEGG